MNLEKKAKMLLLVINQEGLEINLETITRYSEKFNAMISEYHLKKWQTKIVIDKKTGEEQTKWFCVDKEFSRIDLVIKYLLSIKNNIGGNNENKEN